MPSTYAHFHFGQRMLSLYPDAVGSLVQKHRSVYDIGLHGPDILFYYKALRANAVNAIGYAMHEKPAVDFFAQAKDLWQQHRDDRLQAERHTAYLLGFLCHYALDRCCHGYIEKMISVSRLSHTEIEAEFDRFLLLREGRDPLRANLAQHIHPTTENVSVIAHFFPALSHKEITQALEAMVRDHKLLRATGPWKRGALLCLLKISGNYQDMQGLVMRKISNPACRLSNEALYRRLPKAEAECLQITEEYLRCLETDSPLGPNFAPSFGAGDAWQNISLES